MSTQVIDLKMQYKNKIKIWINNSRHKGALMTMIRLTNSSCNSEIIFLKKWDRITISEIPKTAINGTQVITPHYVQL